MLSLPRRVLLAVQSRVHSKQGREFALLLARLNIPIIAINAVTQILVPPPKYMIHTLVPTVTYSDHGKVGRVFVIGQGAALEQQLTHAEAMATLLANTEDAYSFPPFSIMERAITLRKRDLHKGRRRTSSSSARASGPSSPASSAPCRSLAWCRRTSAEPTSSRNGSG